MNVSELKEQAWKANLDLVKYSLVIFTWGNVSAFDAQSGLMAIKPSGVSYDALKAEDMVVLDLEGKKVEGTLRPSSDTDTHLEMFRRFPQLGGMVHTHSQWATSWAQSGQSLPCYGTTHADYFYGTIPCTRNLHREEVEGAYEKETGKVIIETIGNNDPLQVPGILVHSHGPFAWGKSAGEAVHNAVVLEEVAKMGFATRLINPSIQGVEAYILDKHYWRKHGEGAYYGQEETHK